MTGEREKSVSASALFFRKQLADHPISEKLFPVGYRDPHETMSRVSTHLESGGSAVAFTTHPTIEDVMRIGRFFVMWEAIRNRKIGSPAAVHQKFFVDLATGLFDMERTYIPTQHTRARRIVTDGEEMRALVAYRRMISNLLKHNSILVAESQADQMSRLERPTKPVVDFVLSAITHEHIPDVLVFPVGIEIEGIGGNYANARNVTIARHPYIFNIGEAFSAEEVVDISARQRITTDEFIWRQQRTLVAPEYNSE